MIDIIPGEIPEEVEFEYNYERLHSLGKSSPWLLAAAACIMGTGVCCTRKQTKKINSTTIVQVESEPAEPDSLSSSQTRRSPLTINSSRVSHQAFACLPQHQQKIREIINILDTNSAFGLVTGGWIGHLRKLENEIDDVPALSFLWTIFSNDELKNKVQRIFNDAWKIGHREGFLIGIDKGMKRYSSVKLEQDLEPWARSLKTTREAANRFIEKKDWNGLVYHLLSVR